MTSRRAFALLGAVLGALAACPTRGPASRTAKDVEPAVFFGDLRVCSVDRWCWENPMPQGNDLLAVWARGAQQLCAVGRNATALHFNGNVWRREPTGIQRDLHAVWGPPAGTDARQEEFIAVGRRGALLHFREGRWQWRLAGTQADLYAVWGPSDDEARQRSARGAQPEFLVSGAVGTLLSCDGNGCRKLPATTRAALYVIGGYGGATWVAGAGVVLHRAAPSAPFRALQGAGGQAWRSLWIDTQSKPARALVGSDRGTLASCDGARCEAVSLAWPRPRDAAVAGPLLASQGRRGPLRKTDSIAFLGADDQTPFALTVGDGRSSVWRLRRASAGWRAELVQHLRPLQVRALSRLDAQHLVAVGDGGALVQQSGAGWQQEMPTGSTGRLHAVWGRGPTDVYAAGAGGVVLRHDGRSWERLETRVKVTLRALGDDGVGGVYVAGAAGTLLTCDTQSCVQQGLPTRAGLRALWHGASRTVVVGEGGAVLERRGGAAWRTISSSSGADLHAVCGRDDGTVYVAGAHGRLARLAGGVLKTVPSGTAAALYGLACDGDDVWAVGDDVVLRCRKERCERMVLRMRRIGTRALELPAPASTQPTTRGVLKVRVDDATRADAATRLPRYHRAVPDLRRRFGKLALRGVFIDARRRVHVVGLPGRVIFYDGRDWRMQLSAYAGPLRALWGSPAGYLFAVGDGGVILQHIPRSRDIEASSRPALRRSP